MNLNLSAALNNLSFGYVGYQLLREFHLRKFNVSYFPIGAPDLSAFNKLDPALGHWIQNSLNSSLPKYSRQNPTLKQWHINGSQESVGRNQVLLTFHEVDSITAVEKNILNNQQAIIVSSQETKENFERDGVTVPVHFIPLGYDSDYFHLTKKKYHEESITSWLIAGKVEMRKATQEAVRAWLKKFGNNPAHILHLSIFNPFFKPEDNQKIFEMICEGKRYTNVNYLPYTKTLSELNDIYNCADIVMDMSLAEGWSLPSFHTVGLGKHAIIHNASSLKGWANEDNAVLVQPTGKKRAVDGVFFSGQGPFNVGNFWNWDEKDLLAAFDAVLERKAKNKVNEAGLRLQEQFTWAKTVDQIVNVLNA